MSNGSETPNASRTNARLKFVLAMVSLRRGTKQAKTPEGKPQPKKSELRAQRAAMDIRSLTFEVGSHARPSLPRLKSALLDPRTGGKVITQLHSLPAPAAPPASPELQAALPTMSPIHAACLNCTDQEADQQIFCQLPENMESPKSESSDNARPATKAGVRSVAYADPSKLLSFFQTVPIQNLITSPDMGLGTPPSSGGLLSGSVPSPDAISDGLTQITQQLMALGFASSNAVFPNHTGVYPPLDRMSVITYWWGFELVLPPPSMDYLSKVTSISHAVLNFLSAVALVNGGVREILPFVRYISQYVDFEWKTIKAQNQGQGVVCAATWIMPAAMIARPWDFPPRPPPKTGDAKS